MIGSFRCLDTRALFLFQRSRRWPGLERQARKRLRWLDAATNLGDLAAIRSNHLESLRGDRAGQYSIRVNDRWRICFEWRDGKAENVELVDYH